jgi:uroporphyrinogen decarboxylase
MTAPPDFERLRKTVRHEEPDRVPLVEALVEFPIQSQFLGRPVTVEDLPAQVEFWCRAGYDYIPLVVGLMRPGRVTADSAISRMLRDQMAKADNKSWNLEYTSFIADRRRFEEFPWELAAQVDLEPFRTVAPLLPPGMKVIALSGKIFTLSWMLMGFENFAESLLDDEEFAAAVIRKIAEIQLATLEQILTLDHVGAVWVVDDIAYHSGPIISPPALRKHIFPWYQRMSRRCHETGRLFFLHSDGDLRAVLPDLIAMGVDALHPIDPTAMDIVQTKRDYGRDLCLFGNVDTELLRSGTPQQVRQRVEELLRTVAPGGGFALGSGNSVPEWAQLDNYNAMRETVLKSGWYQPCA